MPDFGEAFAALTGNPPFPWQRDLYENWFAQGKFPDACILPTGLGKTSIIAVWLIALANEKPVPRRLVYVVNRRTVVDQTTDEVEKYRNNLRTAELFEVLGSRCAMELKDDDSPLALSTIRGQFADNREWSVDPSRPAVICGTVDMIGSRLLFNGYGVGFKARPLHAGFLGQDALLVHDEAHLEPAFQTLLLSIRDEQNRERTIDLPWPKLRVMELTATSRGGGTVFQLTDDDYRNDVVVRRVGAKKYVQLHELTDQKKLVEQIVDLALTFRESKKSILVFVRTVDDVMKVRDRLTKEKLAVATLTGTMRGKERDALVECPVFRRFLPKVEAEADDKTVFLVCTSAGEVGVNISADHLVCDLSTFDSMAQRFGRVNRFGINDDTAIHVVHPAEADLESGDYDLQRRRTLALLRQLNGHGSPAALGDLDPKARQEAFAPSPTILPTSDLLFDAWALTTIRDKLPGRPHVEPYLHGLPTEWQPPETQVAWREEVERLHVEPWIEWKKREFEEFAAELLDAYPLKPHELLKEPSHRAFRHFEAMAKRLGGSTVPVWLHYDNGEVETTTLQELVDGGKERLFGITVVLPPSAGGLEGGMLNGAVSAPEEVSLDVADQLYFKNRDGTPVRQRKRLLNVNPDEDPEADEMHPVVTIRFPAPEGDEDTVGDVWQWLLLGNEGDKSAKKPVLWTVHVGDVVKRTKELVAKLPLDQLMREAIITAAELHDHGKKRKLFQTVLGNSNPRIWLAKSGKNGGRVPETYRHEFGSLLDVEKDLNGGHRDLILHLIAAHHGRARPHFPSDEAFDPERPHAEAERMATEVPRRFARLQRQYGRWGLAYLESLLRAADWAASASPSSYVEDE